VQLQQFAQRHSLHDPEAPRMLIPEKLLGFLRREALNHTQSIARGALYVNRFHAAWQMAERVKRILGAAPSLCKAAKSG
jgi:hypothetical protein